MSKTFADNSTSIGNTPLVRLNRVIKSDAANVYAKIEARNPSNSIKCRLGANMVWDAERRGVLTPGKTIVEATSGNTGIALAFVAAARGYPLVLTMPKSMSLERRKLLKAFGAQLELTPPEKGMRGAVERAEELVASNPERYVHLKQFDNPANPEIHTTTTGPEIENALEGQIDIFVSGVGTGGTISGVGRYFKELGKKVSCVAVEPSESPIISQTLKKEELTPSPHKIQGIGANFIPKNLDLSVIDEVETVSSEEAIEFTHRLIREEGILAGISSGATALAAKRIAERPENKGKNIVVIIASSAERYLSSPLFSDVFSEAELSQ
ncbi:MAG: cysteine synthase A [Pseudomonadota bacterium]